MSPKNPIIYAHTSLGKTKQPPTADAASANLQHVQFVLRTLFPATSYFWNKSPFSEEKKKRLGYLKLYRKQAVAF